jgi:hypothetical protein
MIRFGPEICRHLAAATQHEWLETNDLGGVLRQRSLALTPSVLMASSPLPSPVERCVLLLLYACRA